MSEKRESGDAAREKQPDDDAPGDAEGAEPERSDAAEPEQTDDADQEPKENRRERRRKKKRGADGDEPRDRNAKVRESLARKKRSAEAAPTPLSAGEMVDDAFARAASASGKWLKNNAALVQALVVAAVLGGVGLVVYQWRATVSAEKSSSMLMAGVMADNAVVDPDSKPADADDRQVVFKTPEQRAGSAIAGYRQVIQGAPGTAAAILARLGEAGILLDQDKWDAAAAAYRDVKQSPLAAADPDVRGRAMEGVGFALEGKGDTDAAIKAFAEIESAQVKGFIELSLYHQARLLAKKGEKDKAVELIKKAEERLKSSTGEVAPIFVKGMLGELHRKLDPASAPKQISVGAGPGGGKQQLTKEDIDKLLQQLPKAPK